LIDICTINSRITTDQQGIENDEIEADLLMTQKLPEILPIKGQRIRFYYPGINKLCLRCYKSGHAKWDYQQQFKTNWLEYVLKFYKADVVSDEMLGTWVDTLQTYHPEFQQLKPIWSGKNKDLRQNIVEHKNTIRKARGIIDQPTTSRGGRGRGRFQRPANQNHRQEQPTRQYFSQDNYQTNLQGRGRGRGSRGRGQPRGRGRGLNYNPNLNPAFGNRRGQFYSDIADNLYERRD